MKKANKTPIQSLTDLQFAMQQLKQELVVQERSLSDRASKLPEEALKSAVSGFLPAMVSGALLTRGWQFIKLIPTIYTLFAAFRKKSP